MTTTTAPASAAPPRGEPPMWPLSVGLFAAMLRSGLLRESDRVYLWRGRLAPRMTTGRPHTIAVLRLYDGLGPLLPPGFFAEPEQPLALRAEATALYPDGKVVRGRPEDFPEAFPTSADVALVAEVADSSLAADRQLAATYAREEIPIYWLVNIPGRTVEVYADPVAGAYRTLTSYPEGSDVPVVLDGREVGRLAVRDLLPPSRGTPP